MKDLSRCISEMLSSLDADAAKLVRIASNNQVYASTIKGIWTDPEASRLILDHTNAFYIREDDKPKKGFPKDAKYIVCEVCIDDPLIRSEIGTHRQLLEFALRSNGLSFEELRVIPARRGMRDRHPFSDDNDAN